MPRTKRAPVVIDTGVLVAVMDTSDDNHAPCGRWLDEALNRRTELVVPVPVIQEVCYFLDKVGGKDQGPDMEATFLELLGAEETFTLYTPDRDGFRKMAVLMRQYAGLRLGAADAAVIVAAENYGTTTIATVDHRDFRAVAPASGGHFTLLPEDL